MDQAKSKSKIKFKLDMKDPNVKNVLVAVFIVGIAVYVWVDQFYIPMRDSITELTEKKERLDAELVRLNALKPQLDRLRRESAALEKQLDSLRNIFPDNKEVAKLIRQLTTVNRDNSIVTTKFTPLPDVVQEYYVENKYNVAIAGDYHNIGRFFSSLANFQLIVNLTNVSITANPNYKRNDPDAPMFEDIPSLFANFELTTFSSRSPSNSDGGS
jgi:Tfp pilus assembly protein PilO